MCGGKCAVLPAGHLIHVFVRFVMVRFLQIPCYKSRRSLSCTPCAIPGNLLWNWKECYKDLKVLGLQYSVGTEIVQAVAAAKA